MRCLFLVFFSRLLFFLPLSISDCFNLIHRLHLQSVLSITIPLLLHHLSSSSLPFFLCSLSLSLSPSLCPSLPPSLPPPQPPGSLTPTSPHLSLYHSPSFILSPHLPSAPPLPHFTCPSLCLSLLL